MGICQGFVKIIKFLAEKTLILYNLTQSLEPGHIRAVVEPQTEIASLGILFVKMVESALSMSILVKSGIVGDTILHGAEYDGIRIYEAVCLGHYLSINASRLMVGGPHRPALSSQSRPC